MERKVGHRLTKVRRSRAVRSQLAAHDIAVPEPRAVNAYLRQHPDLAQLVPALCAKARREFGNPTVLSLELYRDPEIDDSYLTLYVRQENYTPDLLDRIHEVSAVNEMALAKTSGHFLITTDFRALRNSHDI